MLSSQGQAEDWDTELRWFAHFHLRAKGVTGIALGVIGGIQSVPLGRNIKCAGHWGPVMSTVSSGWEGTGSILKETVLLCSRALPPNRASQHLLWSENAEICMFCVGAPVFKIWADVVTGSLKLICGPDGNQGLQVRCLAHSILRQQLETPMSQEHPGEGCGGWRNNTRRMASAARVRAVRDQGALSTPGLTVVGEGGADVGVRPWEIRLSCLMLHSFHLEK